MVVSLVASDIWSLCKTEVQSMYTKVKEWKDLQNYWLGLRFQVHGLLGLW